MRWLQLLSAVALSGLSIWASAAFTRQKPPKTPAPAGIQVDDGGVALTADAPQWKVLKVGVAEPASTRFGDPVPARVRLDESHTSRIGAPLPGRVTSVLVELGQRVKVGTPLFSVASSDIASLRAEREKAALELETAKVQLGRVHAMVEARAIPAKDEIEAIQQQKQAQVALHVAQAKLASLKVSSSGDNEFMVVSPRDGVVVDKSVLPAQQVSTDPGLLTIADLSTVWVIAELFEADAAGISEGTEVKITVPSLPDVAASARVEVVSALVDPARHTIPVRVRLENADGQLRPNIYAQMRFLTRSHEGEVHMPASALVSDGSHQYVYVEDSKGKFARREVAAGPAHDGRIVVSRGVAAGERIVEEGALLLENEIQLAQ